MFHVEHHRSRGERVPAKPGDTSDYVFQVEAVLRHVSGQPSLSRRPRRFTDQQHASRMNEWGDEFSGVGGGSEATAGGNIPAPTDGDREIGHITGPGLNPVPKAQPSNQSSHQVDPLGSSVDQQSFQIGPAHGHDQARNPTARANIDKRSGRRRASINEGPRSVNRVRERSGAQHADALGIAQRIDQSCQLLFRWL